jgi:S-DNA-T family DNA segregation ATPase FtsK/SpoIIIE
VAAAFSTRFVFALADRSDYAMAGVNPRSVPESMPPGRAIRVRDGVEVQFAAPRRIPYSGRDWNRDPR